MMIKYDNLKSEANSRVFVTYQKKVITIYIVLYDVSEGKIIS